MDITQLQYIKALSETGSVTKAAQVLGVSQPAISNWLKATENQLGFQLVIRSRKGLVLTPAGQLYLDGALKMIEIRNQTYQAIARLSGSSTELIRITGTPNGGARIFTALFQQFKHQFPQVSLQFLESYNRRSFQMVEEGAADIGVGSTLDFSSDTLELIHSGSRELVLYIPRSMPLAYDPSQLKKNDPLPSICLEQVRDLPFVMPSAEMSYYPGIMKRFQQANIQPAVIFQSSNVKVLYNMICSGNGVGIAPKRFFSPLDPVAPFSLDPPFFNHAVCFYKKGRQLTEAQQYALDFFQSYAKSIKAD